MFANLSRRGTRPRTTTRLRRVTAALAAVTGGLLAWAARAGPGPRTPQPGGGHHRPAHQEAAMKSQNRTGTRGFVLATDQGQPFWFLNTLTITKVGSDQCRGQLTIVDHRVPPGFAP